MEHHFFYLCDKVICKKKKKSCGNDKQDIFNTKT
jgi:hypothetical protein